MIDEQELQKAVQRIVAVFHHTDLIIAGIQVGRSDSQRVPQLLPCLWPSSQRTAFAISEWSGSTPTSASSAIAVVRVVEAIDFWRYTPSASPVGQ